MDNLTSLIARVEGLHDTLATAHPSLTRGQVWCRTCGYTEQVSASFAMKHGWPKHCGATMTIDSPEEQLALRADHLNDTLPIVKGEANG